MIVPVSLLTAVSLSLISFFVVGLSKRRRSDDSEFKYSNGVLWVMLVGAVMFLAFGLFAYSGGLGGAKLNVFPLLIISIVPCAAFLVMFFYLKSYRIIVGPDGVEVKSLIWSKHYPYESIKELRLINDMRGGSTLSCRDKVGSLVFTVWSGFEGVSDLSRLLRSKASSGFLYKQKDGSGRWFDDIKP